MSNNGSSKLAVLTTLAEGSAEERREAARRAYRASVELGQPVSAATLAEMHERSRAWARERINEVRAEGGMPPEDEVAASSKEVATTDTPGMPRAWPVLLLALPAFVAIWGGWVGLGEMTGFGPVNLLPGIGNGWTINTAITLPIGVEAYAAFALRVWLSGIAPTVVARRFAMRSAIGALLLGMTGQVTYHLLDEAGVTTAPWWVTTFVACLPVVVLGCGAALAHLLHNHERN